MQNATRHSATSHVVASDWLCHMLTGVDSLDVEAMVGAWWVLILLQKSPLKLNAQCGCGVGRKKQEELQHVGPLTVPASHMCGLSLSFNDHEL